MATKSQMQPIDREDDHARAVLARIIWLVENEDTMPSDPEKEKSAYAKARADYLRKAIRLQGHLANNDLVIASTSSKK